MRAPASLEAPDYPDLTTVEDMEPRTLGPTGIPVSPLCLGTMMLGAWGEPDHDEAIRIVHAALDAGITIVDTADMYSAGESEEIVGKALKGRRDDVVLATKFHAPMGEGGLRQGNSRRWMVQAVEDSLRRLQTDWIDLYQVHRPDDVTSDEETLSALTDLQRAGKIRAFGTSTFPAHHLVETQWTAERRGLGRYVTEQPPYSLLFRRIEADVLPVAETYGLGVLPWSPLAGGWLTGRVRAGSAAPETNRSAMMPGFFDDPAKLDAVEQLNLLAEEAGISTVHLTLAFVLQHPAITSPIIGPRTMAQLESQLGAVDVVLTDDVLDRIDEIVPPGRNVSPGDEGYLPPAVLQSRRRRR